MAEMENNKIGALIKSRREALGFTLKQLEEMTGGVSASYINRIENGERCNVSIAVIFAIARPLNIMLDEIGQIYEFYQYPEIEKAV